MSSWATKLGHLVRCARPSFQVLSDPWCEWASVSPLWKKEVSRMFILTLIWVRVHMLSYTAVGRLWMAFLLGMFKNKHASSRQQEGKVHFAEVGTVCPMIWATCRGGSSVQCLGCQGGMAGRGETQRARVGLGKRHRLVMWHSGCQSWDWESGSLGVLLLLLRLWGLLQVSSGPTGSLAWQDDILPCPQAQALRRRVPGALSWCVARVSIGCLFPLTLCLSQKRTY